ncbi:hypothetical protein ACIQRK_33340 [Streptomyces anulatus]
MDLRRGWAQEVEAELCPGQGAVPHRPACTLLIPESLGFSFHGLWVHA